MSKTELLSRAIDCLEVLDKRDRPMCRDCADMAVDGMCPNSGIACDMGELIAQCRAALTHPAQAGEVGNVKSSAGLIRPGKVDAWVANRYTAPPASQEQAQQPSLICRTCGADRFKEPCKNSTTCTMVGEAQAQQPTPASAADMAVYQSIADGYLNAQQPSGGEVVKPLFAASVAARKWAELQADGHRMQSIAFDGGKGGPGTITPWGKVMWGATPKPEPMTDEQAYDLFGVHYQMGIIRAVEAHYGITKEQA